jgi:hypothetical protein
MSWYQTHDGSGSMQTRVQFVEVDWCLAVDAGVGCPERDFAGLRVDQPPVFVVSLVGQRVADLLQVEAAQVQHQARIDLLLPPALEGKRPQP